MVKTEMRKARIGKNTRSPTSLMAQFGTAIQPMKIYLVQGGFVEATMCPSEDIKTI
jgi:hypothetical protein